MSRDSNITVEGWILLPPVTKDRHKKLSSKHTANHNQKSFLFYFMASISNKISDLNLEGTGAIRKSYGEGSATVADGKGSSTVADGKGSSMVAEGETNEETINEEHAPTSSMCTPQKKRSGVCIFCGEFHPNRNCRECYCFKCGTQTTKMCTYCPMCIIYDKQRCKICNVKGHIEDRCTDIWRMYHSTTVPGPVSVPTRNIYKPKEKLYCSNCAKRGHPYEECSERLPNNYHRTSRIVRCYNLEKMTQKTAKHYKKRMNPGQEKVHQKIQFSSPTIQPPFVVPPMPIINSWSGYPYPTVQPVFGVPRMPTNNSWTGHTSRHPAHYPIVQPRFGVARMILKNNWTGYRTYHYAPMPTMLPHQFGAPIMNGWAGSHSRTQTPEAYRMPYTLGQASYQRNNNSRTPYSPRGQIHNTHQRRNRYETQSNVHNIQEVSRKFTQMNIKNSK